MSAEYRVLSNENYRIGYSQPGCLRKCRVSSAEYRVSVTLGTGYSELGTRNQVLPFLAQQMRHSYVVGFGG